MSSDAIKKIEALLSDRIGLNCSAVGSNLILRRPAPHEGTESRFA